MRDLAKGYMGVAEAARKLGISDVAVRMWSDSGRYGLRTVRDPVGRRLLRRKDVELLAETRKKNSKAATPAAE